MLWIPTEIASRRRLATNAVAVFFLVVVLCLTLFPFEFTSLGFEDRLKAVRTQSISRVDGVLDDVVVNVLLFIPLGFSQGLLLGKRFSRPTGILLAAVVGVFLSSIIELLQLYLPFRYSSLLDVISNGAGSTLGYMLFLLWGNRLTDALALMMTPRGRLRRSWVLYAVWFAFFTALVVPLTYALRINHWDKRAPLIVGAKPDGTQHLQGSVTYLALGKSWLSQHEVRETFARGVLAPSSATNLIAEYHFTASPPYKSDVKGVPPIVRTSSGILQTSAALLHPTSWLMYTTSLSLYFECRVEPAAHTGTILFLGKSEEDRSLAIINRNGDLAVAARSMITGFTAGNPELRVPGFFDQPGRYRVLLLLNRSSLNIIKNSPEQQYTFELEPGFALFNRFLRSRHSIDITSSFAQIGKWLFALLVFLPLGYFAGKIIYHSTTNPLLRVLQAVPLLAGPAFVINFVIGNMTGRPLDHSDVLLGFAITACSAVIGLVLVRFEHTPLPKITLPDVESPILHDRGA